MKSGGKIPSRPGEFANGKVRKSVAGSRGRYSRAKGMEIASRNLTGGRKSVDKIGSRRCAIFAVRLCLPTAVPTSALGARRIGSANSLDGTSRACLSEHVFRRNTANVGLAHPRNNARLRTHLTNDSSTLRQRPDARWDHRSAETGLARNSCHSRRSAFRDGRLTATRFHRFHRFHRLHQIPGLFALFRLESFAAEGTVYRE